MSRVRSLTMLAVAGIVVVSSCEGAPRRGTRTLPEGAADNAGRADAAGTGGNPGAGPDAAVAGGRGGAPGTGGANGSAGATADGPAPRDAPAQDGPNDRGAPTSERPPPPDLVPYDAGPHRPNPMLAALPENTALDLGPYNCRDRVPEESMACEKITDFSRLNYDPHLHRVLMFGGGHAATGRTDVDVLDLGTLRWSSLYPSMTCAEVSAGDVDPRGFHRKSGHPVARHSYDQNVIAKVDGIGRLLLLSTEGFAGDCHRYDSPINSVAWLPLAPGVTTWQYSRQFRLPWGYAAAAEFDPLSGMVIVLGQNASAGVGGLYVYDPKADQLVASVGTVGYDNDYATNLVYYPPDQAMYFFLRNTSRVLLVTLSRSEWSKSTSTPLAPGGTPPPGAPEVGYAYDKANGVIGGAVRDGMFYAYDPRANEWRSQRMNVRSSSGATPGSMVFHALDYDPVNNVYVFIGSGTGGKRTWAYRYR